VGSTSCSGVVRRAGISVNVLVLGSSIFVFVVGFFAAIFFTVNSLPCFFAI
jgi:hypothetical protein